MFDHVWFWNPRMGERNRKGKLCTVLARAKRNSILVQLEDGEKVITSRYAVRRIKESERLNFSFETKNYGEAIAREDRREQMKERKSQFPI